MGRRDFLRYSALGAAALALPACSGPGACARSPAPADDAVLRAIGPVLAGVLSRAARAPSSHNTQPWAVRILEKDLWTIGEDRGRRLGVVDPQERELVLSIGAFVEHLVIAAAAAGWQAGVSPASGEPGGTLVEVRLRPAPGPSDVAVAAQIDRRRTLRKGYLDTGLQRADLDALVEVLGPRARWFPRGSPESNHLADWAIASFERQTWSDPAQRELARWTRLGVDDCAAADGLTPDTMEIGGISRFYMRRFMDESSVMGKTFRQRGIEMTREEARRGAGWLVLSSTDESPAALVDAGRRFARMSLRLRERHLAAHPMSQVLEEDPWRGTLGRVLGLEGPPQFVLRIGYVERCADPVSLRRPVGAFTTIAG
jgi:hypothetical protein